MKVIPPDQISTEILDLINRAKKYVVLVSPYVDFTKWEKIKHAIKKAKERGVEIKFFIRLNDSIGRKQIQVLGIEPKLIHYLHAKLYYNEEKGVVTSMNLLTSSTLNAIEFGAVYDTESELKELQRFVKEFLLDPEEVAETPSEYVSLAKSNLKRVNAPEEVVEKLPSEYELSLAKKKFIVVLKKQIRKHYDSYADCSWFQPWDAYLGDFDNEIKIEVGNIFYLSLCSKGWANSKVHLHLLGIISQAESKHADIFIKDFSKKYPDYDTFLGNRDRYNSMDLKSYKPFTSDDFDALNVSEKKEIIDITLNFIKMLMYFKHHHG